MEITILIVTLMSGDVSGPRVIIPTYDDLACQELAEIIQVQVPKSTEYEAIVECKTQSYKNNSIHQENFKI